MRAFFAILRRDIVITKRELVPFLLQSLMQPLFFLFIFGKVLPGIGLSAGNFVALMLPGIVAQGSLQRATAISSGAFQAAAISGPALAVGGTLVLLPWRGLEIA